MSAVQVVIFERATGKIIGSGTTCRPDLISQGPNDVLIGQSARPEDQYVSNGVVLTMPPRPSESHTFDWATHTWIDPRTLDELKGDKWAEIKSAREAVFNAPLVTPHGTFDSDSRGRSNITDAVLMAQALTATGSPVSIDFTLADNTVVTLNAEQMIEVGLYLGAKVQGAYAVSRTLRAAIDAATTSAEVQAVSWP